MNMQELSEWLKSKTGDELAMTISEAVALAKQDTLAEIRRLYPRRARGHDVDDRWLNIGRSKKYADITYRSGSGVVIPVMFYSNYLARWEITGAFGRVILRGKKRKGQRGPAYQSKSDFYAQNIHYINAFMATRVKEYLTKKWR